MAKEIRFLVVKLTCVFRCTGGVKLEGTRSELRLLGGGPLLAETSEDVDAIRLGGGAGRELGLLLLLTLLVLLLLLLLNAIFAAAILPTAEDNSLDRS